MFILRPSSPLGVERSRSEPVIRAAPAEGGSDLGPALPESYDVDIVRAMLQDPFRIFVYWEIRDDTIRGLNRFFSPEEAAGFKVVLRLVETTGQNEAFFEVAGKGRYWMTVFPDREYEFEIGVRSPLHGYIALVHSNRIRTPRATVSPETATEDDYRLSSPDFADILDASGFGAIQALSIKVSGLPGSDLPADWLSALLLGLPESLRRAITHAAAGGRLTADLISMLPEPLRSELLRLLFATDGVIAAAALMHYLPELLRTAMESGQEWIGGHLHPIVIAPKFFVGASENVTRPGGELGWPGLPGLPSFHGRPSSADLIRSYPQAAT
jgi:hypothetical protein